MVIGGLCCALAGVLLPTVGTALIARVLGWEWFAGAIAGKAAFTASLFQAKFAILSCVLGFYMRERGVGIPKETFSTGYLYGVVPLVFLSIPIPLMLFYIPFAANDANQSNYTTSSWFAPAEEQEEGEAEAKYAAAHSGKTKEDDSVIGNIGGFFGITDSAPAEARLSDHGMTRAAVVKKHNSPPPPPPTHGQGHGHHRPKPMAGQEFGAVFDE